MDKADLEAIYHEQYAAFLGKPSPNTTESLLHALRQVDVFAIDRGDFSRLAAGVRDLQTDATKKFGSFQISTSFEDTEALQNGSPNSADFESLRHALAASRLLLAYRHVDPRDQWLGAVVEPAAAVFRVAASVVRSNSDDEVGLDLRGELGRSLDAWIDALHIGQLETHQVFPLLTGAMSWLFYPVDVTAGTTSDPARATNNDDTEFVSNRMTRLVAAAYSQLAAASRDHVLHQLLAEWRKFPDAHEAVADLVLSVVSVAGQISISMWNDAVAQKMREPLEHAAIVTHKAARQAAELVSRRLIDANWRKPLSQRTALTEFMAEVARRAVDPHWAAAELFLTTFVATLFRLASAYRGQRYPLFLLETLRPLYETLSELEINEFSGRANAGDLPASEKLRSSTEAVTTIIHMLGDQGLYLASRQMLLPQQPFYDYHLALTAPKTHMSDWGTDGSATLATSWRHVLSQWSISTFHAQITSMLMALAARHDLRDAVQADIFRLLERIVCRDHTKFDAEWLGRISQASPAVCEALVPLVAHVYAKSRDPAVLQPLLSRVHAPGAVQLKKRVLTLVLDCHLLVPPAMVWETLLVLAADLDYSVRGTALKATKSWLLKEDTNLNAGADLSTERGASCVNDSAIGEYAGDAAGNNVVNGLIEAQNAYPLIVTQGLGVLLLSMDREETGRVIALVADLLRSGELKLALTFVSIRGLLMPASAMKELYERRFDDPEALQIINCGLVSRPRLILSPALATGIFTKAVQRLKTASERDIEPLSSILGQLINLGDAATQQNRAAVLVKVFRVSFNLLKQSGDSATTGGGTLWTQAVLIASGARFWPVKTSELTEFVHHVVGTSLTKPEATRLMLIRVVFAVVIDVESLLGDEYVCQYFASFAEGSTECTVFTNQLLKLLWNQSGKTKPSRESPLIVSSGVVTSTNLPKGSPHHIGLHNSNAATILLQRNIRRLITIASSAQDIAALRVIVKAMEDNLVVIDDCIPLITSLSFASHPAVAQTAMRAFITAATRWPRSLGRHFVAGLRQLPVDVSLRSPLPQMWQALRASQRGRDMDNVIAQLGHLLDWRIDRKVLETVVDGLAMTTMEPRDAKQLAQVIEDNTILYDAQNHSREDTAKVFVLVLLVLWLRQRYDPTSPAALAHGEPDPIELSTMWPVLMGSDDLDSRLRKLWSVPYYGAPLMEKIVPTELNKLITGPTEISFSLPAKRQKTQV